MDIVKFSPSVLGRLVPIICGEKKGSTVVQVPLPSTVLLGVAQGEGWREETSRTFEGMGNESRYLFLGLCCLPPARLPLVHWMSSSYGHSKLLWGRPHHLAVLSSSGSCSPSFTPLGLEMLTVYCILSCWFPSIKYFSITTVSVTFPSGTLIYTMVQYYIAFLERLKIHISILKALT